MIKVLYRAKFEFPSHWKACRNLVEEGLTNSNADEFGVRVAGKQLLSEGCGIEFRLKPGSPDK